jgi:hypothetical protein
MFAGRLPMRAPLRHVAGFAGSHYVEMIPDSANRMGKLIDGLLAFSRISRQSSSMGWETEFFDAEPEF